MQTLKVCAAMAFLGALVAGCASSGGRLEAPAVSMAGILLTEDAVSFRVRVRNVGDGELRAESLEIVLTGDDGEWARTRRALDFNIPPQGVETVAFELTGSQTQPLRSALSALRDGAAGSLSYRLSGELSVRPDGRRFDFRERATLTPTPGRPNAFR